MQRMRASRSGHLQFIRHRRLALTADARQLAALPPILRERLSNAKEASRMKCLPAILFVSGLAIQLAALLGEHAAEIPLVIKHVAPSYFRAQTGIDTLQRSRRLGKADVGYHEIARWLIGNMHEINGRPRNLRSDTEVDSISCMGEFRSEGTPHGDEVFLSDDIRCTLSTVTNRFVDAAGRVSQSLEFHFHTAALKTYVEELKTPGVLRFCFGLFFIGGAVEVVAFVLEHGETRKAEAAETKKHPCEATEKADQKQPCI